MKKIGAVLCVLLCWGGFAAPAGADEPEVIRLGIMKFLSRADNISDQQAEAVGDIFARMLTNSKFIAVVERDQLEAIASEHKLGATGQLDANTAIQIGKIVGCQYMLIGAVTNLSKKGNTTDFWLWGTKKEEASVTIDVRVVNVETSEVVLSLSETGTASQSGEKFNFYGMTKNEAALIGMEAGAINEATSRLGFRVRETLTGEYAQVINVDGKEVTLNVGLTSGVRNGGLYRIYTEGAEVKDTDGKSLGRKVNAIAVVKVVDAENEFSIAHVDKGSGNIKLIQRGDKVGPISASDAASLVKRKAFPTSRPVKKSSDSEKGIEDIRKRLEEIEQKKKK